MNKLTDKEKEAELRTIKNIINNTDKEYDMRILKDNIILINFILKNSKYINDNMKDKIIRIRNNQSYRGGSFHAYEKIEIVTMAKWINNRRSEKSGSVDVTKTKELIKLILKDGTRSQSKIRMIVGINKVINRSKCVTEKQMDVVKKIHSEILRKTT